MLKLKSLSWEKTKTFQLRKTANFIIVGRQCSCFVFSADVSIRPNAVSTPTPIFRVIVAAKSVRRPSRPALYYGHWKRDALTDPARDQGDALTPPPPPPPPPPEIKKKVTLWLPRANRWNHRAKYFARSPSNFIFEQPTFIITNSAEQSRSWKPDSRSAAQNIPYLCSLPP